METAHSRRKCTAFARGAATGAALLGSIAVVLLPWLTANAAPAEPVPSVAPVAVEVHVMPSDWAAQPPLLGTAAHHQHGQ